MKAEDFRRWRKTPGLNRKNAARTWGLSKRVVQHHDKGKRDGRKADIPLSVPLACCAIAKRGHDYNASEIRGEPRCCCLCWIQSDRGFRFAAP